MYSMISLSVDPVTNKKLVYVVGGYYVAGDYYEFPHFQSFDVEANTWTHLGTLSFSDPAIMGPKTLSG